jgi:hypothetical protein
MADVKHDDLKRIADEIAADTRSKLSKVLGLPEAGDVASGSQQMRPLDFDC